MTAKTIFLTQDGLKEVQTNFLVQQCINKPMITPYIEGFPIKHWKIMFMSIFEKNHFFPKNENILWTNKLFYNGGPPSFINY